jgi:hypothetical protein
MVSGLSGVRVGAEDVHASIYDLLVDSRLSRASRAAR